MKSLLSLYLLCHYRGRIDSQCVQYTLSVSRSSSRVASARARHSSRPCCVYLCLPGPGFAVLRGFPYLVLTGSIETGNCCMRIGYVHSTDFPTVDANVVQVVQMCRGFASFGHEVTLFHSPRRNVCVGQRRSCGGASVVWRGIAVQNRVRAPRAGVFGPVEMLGNRARARLPPSAARRRSGSHPQSVDGGVSAARRSCLMCSRPTKSACMSAPMLLTVCCAASSCAIHANRRAC